MTEKIYQIKIASDEKLIISMILEDLGAIAIIENDGILLINKEEAFRVQDYLTTELARSGFDSNYEITGRGKIIESLIDKLQVAF